MNILENNSTSKKIVKENLSKVPEGTQFCIGSSLINDMDYYTHDDSGNIMMAIASMIETVVKSGRYDSSTDCITIDIDVGDKVDIDDEGNIIEIDHDDEEEY